MKVLMLSAALWRNNLGRLYPFAKKISEDHEVIVAGPYSSGRGVYPIYSDLDCKKIRIDSKIQLAKDLKELITEDFDIIHCFKPVVGSLPLSIFLKFVKRKPLILDIEDLEFYPNNILDNFTPLGIVNSLHPAANKKIVGGRLLQKMYGGEIIRTSADVSFIKPGIRGSLETKKKIGLENNFVITFIGNPRKYKGLDIALKAIKMCNKADIKFLYVGPLDDPVFVSLYKKYRRFIRALPPQNYEMLNIFMDLTDMVIIPQRGNLIWSVAQTPVKLFDAMAAAKPIAVSDVGDLPLLIGDAGIVVKDGDVKGFSEAILNVYNNDLFGKELARKARERCVKYYSWDVLKKKTLTVYKEVLNRH